MRHIFSILIYLLIIEMGFDSIYLYFLDLNLHYTQLFSSRARFTPLPQQLDVSRFLSQKYSTRLKLMH